MNLLDSRRRVTDLVVDRYYGRANEQLSQDVGELLKFLRHPNTDFVATTTTSFSTARITFYSLMFLSHRTYMTAVGLSLLVLLEAYFLCQTLHLLGVL